MLSSSWVAKRTPPSGTVLSPEERLCRGTHVREPCCARDFVSRARADRRRSHRSCQPEVGEAVGGSRPTTYSGGSRPSSSSFAFQAIGSWVAVLLLVNQPLIAELLWLGSSAGLKGIYLCNIFSKVTWDCRIAPSCSVQLGESTH